MSKVCEVTGARPRTGKNVSFSHKRSNRWFRPNIQRKRYYIPSENRWITLTLSTKAIKTIQKNGIESVVAKMRAEGKKV